MHEERQTYRKDHHNSKPPTSVHSSFDMKEPYDRYGSTLQILFLKSLGYLFMYEKMLQISKVIKYQTKDMPWIFLKCGNETYIIMLININSAGIVSAAKL